MDIQKPDNSRARKIKRGIYAGVLLLFVGGTSIAVSRLRPTGPTDRFTIWPGEVKRGAMLSDVHGIGTLVPEDIRWIPVQNGTVTLDVELPGGARTDLTEDGTIELENLRDILFVGRPAHGQPETAVGLFKMVGDGSEAVRVNVKLGRASVNSVEVLQGLNAGDVVILSDRSNWDSYERIRLR